MAMAKSTNRRGVAKFAVTFKRASEFKSLASAKMEKVRGIATRLVSTTRGDIKKLGNLVEEAKERKLEIPSSKKTSKFGKLIGKLGNVGKKRTPEAAAKVIDDLAIPMVNQILTTAKAVMDKMEVAKKGAVDGLQHIQINSIENSRRFKEQSRKTILERSTSMITKIQTFAKQTYGGFLPQEKLDEIMKIPVDELLGKVSIAL